MTRSVGGGDVDGGRGVGGDGGGGLYGPGTRIDRYVVRELIGEGGFGVVYRAEQVEPMRRPVAIKVVKPGMDSRAVIGRFEAERQALAMMDHPQIARVLDGGTTGDGRPFFVMQLVRGEPITTFSDRNCLTIEQRCVLMQRVCYAIQHAHTKGVVHRDIKPGNVLVGYNADGIAMPTVIDFGVAKALGQRLSEHTVYTPRGQMVGTPAYMSPEQAEMTGVDIDTRSDIYSLGILLYELLVGRPPFDFSRAGHALIEHTIRDVDPLPPSVRISELLKSTSTGSEAAELTRSRQAGLRSVRRLLRDDLDFIVMKCLEKNRERRYAAASELADDLRGVGISERGSGVRSARARIGRSLSGSLGDSRVFVGCLLVAVVLRDLVLVVAAWSDQAWLGVLVVRWDGATVYGRAADVGAWFAAPLVGACVLWFVFSVSRRGVRLGDVLAVAWGGAVGFVRGVARALGVVRDATRPFWRLPSAKPRSGDPLDELLGCFSTGTLLFGIAAVVAIALVVLIDWLRFVSLPG